MIKLKQLIERRNPILKEDDKGEVMVGGYQTQHFDICPGATALYKDIESKGVDMDVAVRTAKLQDVLFFIEKHVEEEGYDPDPYYSEVAQILGDQIMTMAGMMDLGSEHEYIQGHIDRIQSAVGGNVNEGKNDAKIRELEAKLKSIKGKGPGDEGIKAAIRDDIQRLKNESMVSEAPNYELYHDTYTSAINTALQYSQKSGYTTDKEEVADLVGLQSRRPGRGKTTRVSIPLYKNGKLQRKALQIVVYAMDTNSRNPFELTTYIR